MRLHRTRPSRRGGFTLIELLVVIAIIAVLISLTSAAVFWAFVKMDEVRTRTEVNELASSLKQFESDFNIAKPPPSRLMLDETGAYNPASYPGYGGMNAQQKAAAAQVAADSSAYIKSVWPRIQYPVDWNNDGQIGGPNGSVFVLEGEQSIVFWLGGARGSNGVPVGFSIDTTNPMRLTGNTARKGPYFQFTPQRLSAGANGFPTYIDPYGAQPYAYFSSGKGANHYGDYAALGSDCAALGVSPYTDGTNYQKPDTFQIISAGRNKAFGPGGLWSPTNIGGAGGAGRDDISNFYDKLLGYSQ